jgi:hypothetical protein
MVAVLLSVKSLCAANSPIATTVDSGQTDDLRFEACEVTSSGAATGSNFTIRAGEGYFVHAHVAAGPVNLNDITHPVCL